MRGFRPLVVSSPLAVAIGSVLGIALPGIAWGQTIITTPSTGGARDLGTRVDRVEDNVIDVRSGRTRGKVDFNSFGRFEVGAGDTVNLRLTEGANSVVNLVWDARALINGTLNSYMGEEIGGRVFFADSHGFVVGQSGVLNVGSLAVSTPTQAAMNGLLGEALATTGDTPHLDALIQGRSDLSGAGVDIAGRINARDEVRIRARAIDASGTVWVAETPGGTGSGGAVNTGADDGVRLIQADGRIQLEATRTLTVAGTLHAAGSGVLLHADDSVSIASGAVVSSRDLGGQLSTGSDAAVSAGDSGSVVVTGRDITVATGARIEADANGGHSGGDVRLRASDRAGGQSGQSIASSSVTVAGALRGNDIELSAVSIADSSWTDPDADLVTIAGNELAELASKSGSDLGGTLGYLATDTRAEVVIGTGAEIVAAGDVTALAITGQTLQTSVTGLKGEDQSQDYVSVGALWADLDTVAKARVEAGATIDAGGALQVKAETDNILDISATSFAAEGTTVATTLAISTIDVQADATVEAGADLRVGSLDVAAQNRSSFSTTAKAHSDEEGAVGIAAAVSLQDVSANAWLGADVDAAGDVTVQAASLASRNAMEANVSAPPDEDDDEDTASQGGGESDAGDAIAGLMGKGFDKLSGELGNQDAEEEGGGGATPSTFRLGGAMTYLEGDHAASAKIGSGAEIAAAGDVAVHADVEAAGISIIAGTSIAAQGEDAQGSALSLSAGVSLTRLAHDAEAEIGDGVVVDARRIGVGSEVVLPHDLSKLEAAKPDFSSFEAFIDSLNAAKSLASSPWEIFTSYGSASASADTVALGGVINHYQVTNNSRAWVGEGASLTSRAAALGEGGSPGWHTDLAGADRKAEWLDAVSVQALSDAQSIHAAGELKIGSLQTGQDGTAVGGSFNNVVYNTTTIAGIAADAEVTAANGVAVDATTRDNVVSLALMSGKGSSIGVDGTMALLDVSSTTRASVSRDAHVTARALEVDALQDLFVWSVSGALAMANSISVGLGVAVHNLSTDTRAYIGDNSVDAPGAAPGAVASEGVRGDGRVRVDSLRVDARSEGLAGAIAVAGAVTQSDSQQTPVEENKKPGFMARLKDSAESRVDGARSSAADAFSGLPGLDTLTDRIRGEQGAGADTSPTPAQPRFGISVSGSASVNLVSQDVAAYLDGADIAGRPSADGMGDVDRIDVAALNDTVLASASGSAAITRARSDESRFSAAIGGAVAYSMVDNDTDAHVGASRLVNANDVAVHALSGGEQTNVALGVSVNASSNQSTAVSAAGSFTIGRSSNDTRAALEDSEVIAGDAHDSTLDISAYGRTHVGIGAGSLYYGGRGGIGAAFTHGDIQDETGASIGGGTVSGYDRVGLSALDASRIIAGSAMAGGGAQTNGLAGAVVYNNVDNVTRARISGGALIDIEGDLLVRAAGTGPIATFEDRLHAIGSDPGEGFNYTGAGLDLDVQESDGVDLLDSGTSIIAVAGLVQAGKNNVGISFVGNDVSNVHAVEVTDAELSTGGTARLDARDSTAILGISIGVGVATGKFAAVGNATANMIENRTEVLLGDAAPAAGETVFNVGALDASALDSSFIGSLAGNVAVGSKAAMGAAISYNEIGNITAVTADGIEVDADGITRFDARNNARIISGAIAGSVGSNAAVSGSFAWSEIGNTTESVLRNSLVQGDGLGVYAGSGSDIFTLSGSVAVSSTAGIGAAINIADIGDRTEARVEDSGVEVDGDIEVTAVGSGIARSLAVAGAVAGNAAVGGSSSNAIVDNVIAARVSGLSGLAAGAGADQLIVRADNTGVADSLAGAIAGSSSVAVGAAVSVNLVGGETVAELLDSELEVRERVAVEAASAAQISTLAAAGSGAGSVGGSLTSTNNVISSRTRATLADTSLQPTDADADLEEILTDTQVSAVDSSRIDSIATSVGAGGAAGLGAAVAVNVIGTEVNAEVLGGRNNRRYLGRNLVVHAESNSDGGSGGANINTIAAGAGGGGTVGGAGSVAVNLLEGSVSAEITDGADIVSVNNVGVLAANTQGINVFAGALAGGGTAGVGLGTVVNVMEGSTRAAITGADTRVSALATDAGDILSVDDGTLADVSLAGIEDIADFVMPDLRGGTREVSGLAVNAASRQHVTTIGASAAAGGYAAGALMAGANVIGGQTEAVIEAAKINRHADFALADPDEQMAGIELNWQEVDVRASSHAVGANMVAGFAGAGGGAGAGALATNVFNGHTSAAIRDADLSAMQDVVVAANASQNSLLIGAGLAAGGLAGGAGTAIVNVFDASTEAAVEGGELEARSLDVEAINRNVAGLVGGAVAGGGAGAVAGSFVVNVSQTRTSATLGSADTGTTVDVRDGIAVTADAGTRVEGVAVSGAAGGAVGVAGMAQVNVIANSVEAAIHSADVEAGGDTLVAAHETLLLNAYSGAMGLAVFGGAAGAGASVAVLGSQVAAMVVDSDISALGNVEVTAGSDREVDMVALTAGAGASVGIGAAASVLLSGVGDIGDTGSELGGTLAALDSIGQGSKVDAEVVGGTVDSARLDKLEQDAHVRLDAALDGGEDRVMALILDSRVEAQDVSVDADSTLSSSNLAGGLGVGALGAGGGVAFSGLYGSTLAMVEQTRAGATDIQARGDVAISASSGDGAAGAMAKVEAYAGGAGLVGLGAAVAIGRISQEVTASVAGTLAGGGGLSISADDDGSMDVDAIGAAAGAAAAGIVVADARRDSVVSAALHGGSHVTGFSAFDMSALGSGSVSAYGLGAAGGVIAAGTGAGVTARDDSTVTASIGDAAVVEVVGDGGTRVAATLLQDVEAIGHGAAVSGGVTVGAVVVEAASSARAVAEVGDDAVFSGGHGLEIASRVAPANGSGGISATSIAGTGGLFVSLNASSTRAHSQASSIARVGDDVRLPDGDILIVANNSTRQSAEATGISVGGLAAAGAVVVNASSDTVTRASLGDGATNHDGLEDTQPTGSLLVKAEGVASNTAKAVGGSGGLVSGNAARASTDAKADVSATIGEDAHLLADSIGVSASHESLYQANSDSRNAAVIGGSGAMAVNTADARVHAGIGDRTQLHSGGGIDIRALNVFDALGASTTSAAGGGVINGSAADMRTRLTGRSSADVGEQAMLFSGLAGSLDGNGDISVVAATRANARDEADLSTGGAIDVAVVASAIEADFDNAVEVGREAVLGSFGYLNLGTYTQGVLASSALVNTWGLAAVGRSRSNVDIDDRHSVVVGDSAKLESLRNTYILAGSDRYGLMDSRIGVVSNAEGYVRGLIAVPSAASNVDVSSHGNLVLGQGSEVLSASNVTIGAPETALNLAANGVGRGYQLGFIPVTQRSSNANGDATGTVVIDGDVVAGRYNELEIRIDSAGNLVQLSGLPVNALGLSSFNAGEFLNGLCGGDASADSCVALQALANVVDAGDNRGAWVLAPMFAAGGDVFLDGTSISGSGSVNAQGDARIEVINESNRHLLVSAIEIPDNPGGNVNFVGAAGSAGNVDITESPAGGMPSVKLHNAGGTATSAPVLMTMEDIHNISGSVELRSDHGSIGQFGTVYAAQQNVHAPNGVVTFSNRNADWFTGSNPMSDWKFSLRHGLFGGLLYSWVSNPDLAVVVIANAQFNADSLLDLNNKIYYRPPVYDGNGNRSGNSLVLFGSCLHGTNGGKNDAKDGCLGGPFGTFSTRYKDHKGVGAAMPLIPFLGDSYMNRSVANYDSNPDVARNAGNSSFRGQQIFVEARYIDINSRISAGAGTNWSLNVNDSPQLQKWLAEQDKSGSGLVRIPEELLGADAGSSQIGAHYDVANRRIVVDDVNASGGGLVHLDGRIVSTTPHGAIDVSSGFGQVSIDSGLDRRVQLQDINVGAGPDGVVTIIDRLKQPTQYGSPYTTWYVHSDGETHAYDNRNGATSYLNGVELANASTYNPQANTRFEWSQQARVQRSGLGGKWYWVDQAGRPLDDGQEWRVTGSGFRTNVSGAAGMGVYESRITGSFNATNTHGVGYSCKKDGWCSYGYDTGYNWAQVPPFGSDGAYGHGRVVWEFSHATRGTLNVTSSVKADNAIRIDFVGNQHGLVDVDTTGDLLLSGRIYNPGGLTRLGTSSGVLSGAGDIIRTTDRAMITTRRLEVEAAGGVGMTGQGGLAGLQVTLGEQGALVPGASQRGIHVRSGSSAGVDLDIRSDAPVDVVAGSAVAGYGDVRIQANGDIVALNPQAAVNVTGSNISLESRNGAIGSTAAPLQLRAVESYLSDNSLVGGRVEATASGDIGLRDSSGDFWVGRIESRFGDVYLDAPSGSLLDASLRLNTDGASEEHIAQVRERLRLDGSGVQESVAAHEGQVNSRYREYWQLRDLGQMVDGSYVPGADLVPLFRAVAEAARGEQGLSDQQVLDYVVERMQGLEAFFANEFGADWQSQQPFLAHDTGFAFELDPASERYAELGRNAAWTEQELRYSINANALRPSGGSVTQAEPTIIGRNIRLNARDDVGRLAPDLDIAYQDLLSGNLDDNEALTLALANAPGDVLIIGRDGRELSQEDLANLTDQQIRDGAIQSIRIKRTSPLFIQAAQSLAGGVGGNAYLQGMGNLMLDGLHVGGDARLAANGHIANAIDAAGPVLTTGGDLVLNAGGDIGRVGAEDEALAVAVGGRLLSASSGQNLLLTQTAGDLIFGSVYANGRIGLQVPDGSLLAFQDQVSLEGNDVHLSAKGDIAGIGDGGQRRALKLNVGTEGTLDAEAGGRIWLSSPERGLNIGSLEAGSHIDLLVEGGTLSAQRLHSRAGTLVATVLGAMRVGHAEGAHGVFLNALGGIEAGRVEGRDAELNAGEDIEVGVVQVDGSATLDAGRAVRITQGGNVQADRVAIDARDLEMLADSHIEAGSSVDVFTTADQVLARVEVGETGLIHLEAGGRIVGNGDAQVHLVGGGQAAANLQAGTGIGTGPDALRASIGHMDGYSSEGDIHLDLPDGGFIGTLTAQDGSIRLHAGDALSFGLLDAAHALSVDGRQLTGQTATAGAQGLQMSSETVLDVDRVSSAGKATLESGTDTTITTLEVGEGLTATAGANLVFGSATVGGDASLDSAGNTAVDVLDVVGNLLATSGADLMLGTATIGSKATLDSAGSTTIDELEVGADLAATAGESLVLHTGTIHGNATLASQADTALGQMAVAGELTAEAGARFDTADLAVDGNAAVTATDIALTAAQVGGRAELVSHASTTLGTLDVAQALSAQAGTSLMADQVAVGGSAELESGTDTTITTLEVGEHLAAAAVANLALGSATVGGDASLEGAGNTTVDVLDVVGDMLATSGADLVLGTATIGSDATLLSDGNTTIGVLEVGADLAATAGENLALQTGTIHGNATLASQADTNLGQVTVVGDLAAEAGAGFDAVDLEVGGNAAVTAADIALTAAQVGGQADLVSHASTTLGILDVGRALSAQAGTSLVADQVAVGDSAELESGTDTTITTLEVGESLTTTAGANLVLGTASVGGDATLDSASSTTINVLEVGADLDATTGENLVLQMGAIHGNATLASQADTALGQMAVAGELAAEAGAGFSAADLTVGGNAAVTAADIALITAKVDGRADLVSHASTTVGTLDVGRALTAQAGTSLVADQVAVGGSAELVSGTDTTIMTMEVGEHLAAAAGANLALGSATVGGDASLDSVGNTTIDVLEVGADLDATTSENLVLQMGTIHGNATLASQADTALGQMAVAGELTAEAGARFDAADLAVGGNAAVTAADIALTAAQVGGRAELVSHASTTLGTLDVAQALSAQAGTSLMADQVAVGGSAELESGTDTTIDVLDVASNLLAVSGADLALGSATVGGDASLDSVGNTTIDVLDVTGNLLATSGADLTLGTATVGGDASLDSAGNTTVDVLDVGADLTAAADENLLLQTGTIHGNATLVSQLDTDLGQVTVAGDLGAEAGAGFSAADLTVGGNAAVTAADIVLITTQVDGRADLVSHASTTLGTLDVGRALSAQAGTSLVADQVAVGGSAELESGTNTTITALEVGEHLTATAGANLALGSATVGGDASLDSVGNTTIDVLEVGADLAATAGESFELQTGSIHGNATLASHADTTLGQVTVAGELTAEAGARFDAADLTVGGNAAVTAADIALTAAQVGGRADLVSHASTTVGTLDVGRALSAQAGTSLVADQVAVGGSAELESGTDTTITTLEVGENFTAVAGANLALGTATVGGDASLDSAGNTMIDVLDVAGNLLATSGADLTLGTATIGGDASLASVENTSIDALDVGAHLSASAGQGLVLQLGSIGGQADLSAGRNAGLGELVIGENLDVEAGNSIAYTSLDAGGGIRMLAGEGDIDGGTASARQAITFEAGNDIHFASILAGQRADLAAGRNVDGQVISALETDVVVRAGHDIDLDDVSAARDVVLHAGNGIRLADIDAGRDLGADAGMELVFGSIGAGRDLTLRSRGGDIEGGLLQAGRNASVKASESVSVDDSQVGSNYRVVAGADVGLQRYRMGGQLDLDAGGDVVIGEGRGEGVQRVDAGGSIAYASVAGADAIHMEASGGDIDGQLLSAPEAFLSARDQIGLDLARIDSRLNLAASDVRGVVEQTGSGDEPIEMVLTGYRDGVAQRIMLTVDARDAWVMNRLAAMQAELESSVAKVDIEDGRIGETMSLTTPVTRTWMHNQDPALRAYDVQLIQPGLDFMLSQRGNLTFTDAFVVRYGAGFWVEAPNHLAPRTWADVDYYAESALRFTFRTLEGELWSHQGLARHPFSSWGIAPATDEDPVHGEPNAVNTGVSH